MTLTTTTTTTTDQFDEADARRCIYVQEDGATCRRDDMAGRGLCRMHRQREYRAGRMNQWAAPVRLPELPHKCTVGYCPDDAKTAGYCTKHYTNMRKHGTPEAPRPRPTKGVGGDPVEFVRGIVTVTDGGCWEVPTHGGRYGQVTYGGARWQFHRWAWVHLAGLSLRRWPKEQLDHICGNTACIRPAHLQKVTQAQNNELRNQRAELLAGAGPDQYLAAPNKPRTLVEWGATVRLSPQLLEHDGWGMPQNFNIIYR